MIHVEEGAAMPPAGGSPQRSRRDSRATTWRCAIASDATLIGANVVAPLMTPIFGDAVHDENGWRVRAELQVTAERYAPLGD